MKNALIIKLTLIFFFFASIAFAEPFSVITKTNTIRQMPRFFSPVKAYVKYGDVVYLISKEGDWFRVRFKNITGYIHKSAIEKRVISPSTTYSQRSGVSEEEIILAGKGFNPQVERSYREKYPQMRYDLVDKVENFKISETELISFIQTGGLTEPK